MTAEEMALKYQKNNDKDALSSLFNQYDPLIRSTVNAFSGSTVPRDLLIPEAKIMVASAAKSFNPNKGNITTHIQNHLKGMQRIVNNASTLYIPEARTSLISAFKSEYDDLFKKLKRNPTNAELADSLSLPLKEVGRLAQETMKTIIPQDEDIVGHIAPHIIDDDHLLEFVYNRCSDIEKKVMGRVYGMHGKRKMKTNVAIGDDVGLSESGVRNVKDRIAEKIEEYA